MEMRKKRVGRFGSSERRWGERVQVLREHHLFVVRKVVLMVGEEERLRAASGHYASVLA
jgi:hypothetical protein